MIIYFKHLDVSFLSWIILSSYPLPQICLPQMASWSSLSSFVLLLTRRLSLIIFLDKKLILISDDKQLLLFLIPITVGYLVLSLDTDKRGTLCLFCLDEGEQRDQNTKAVSLII